jgi:hypothetical protein
MPGLADLSVGDNTFLAPALPHFRAVLEFESLCPPPDALENRRVPIRKNYTEDEPKVVARE